MEYIYIVYFIILGLFLKLAYNLYQSHINSRAEARVKVHFVRSDDPDCNKSPDLGSHRKCKSDVCIGKLMKKIIKSIDSAKNTIYIAMYEFTNDHLTKSILKARSRGINVYMIVDRSKMLDGKDKCAHLKDFKKAGVEIGVAGENRKLMHHKFCLIDPMSSNGIVINGSLNWSKGGILNNCENVTFISIKRIQEKYKETFFDIWEQNASPFIS